MEGVKNVANGFKGNTKLCVAFPYAAPEVLEAYKAGITHQRSFLYESDIYSFGIICYEMVTRSIAWEFLEDHRIMEHVLKGDRPDFDSIKKRKWKKEIQLIVQCWAQSPADRPTALDIAE